MSVASARASKVVTDNTIGHICPCLLIHELHWSTNNCLPAACDSRRRFLLKPSRPRLFIHESPDPTRASTSLEKSSSCPLIRC